MNKNKSHIYITLKNILTELKHAKLTSSTPINETIKNDYNLPFNSARGNSINHTEYKTRIFGNILGNLNMSWSYGGLFGKWAYVPWIRIFNNRNKSPESGCYLIYLFSVDLKRVYLSLNIGVNNINKDYNYRTARKKISNKSKELRHRLYKHFNLNKDLTERIKLTPDNKSLNSYLPKEYELGNIIAKEYSLKSFSRSKEKERELNFSNDLKYMINLYNNFDKRIQHKKSPNKEKYDTNQHNDDPEKNDNDKNDINTINKRKNDDGEYGEKTLCKELIHDYQSNRYITIIGKSKIFRDKLQSKFNGIISKTDDNAGFDYEVINKNNKEKLYIDAKTNRNNEKSFYMSANEKYKMNNISKRPNEDYLIYLIYNIKDKNNEKIEYISNKKGITKQPNKLIMKLNKPLGKLNSSLKFIPVIYEVK